MSYLFLIAWQFLFFLQPLAWPAFGSGALEFPVTAVTALAGFIAFAALHRDKLLESQFWVLLAFMAVIVVSGFFNGWLGGGVQRAQSFLLTAFIPFVLYSNLTVSEARVRFVLFLSLCFAVIMVSNGVSQLASPTGFGWAGTPYVPERRITFTGILQDPNDLGGYFVMCLPFAAFFMRHGKLSLVRIMSFFFLICICYGIFLTNSRGTLLACLGMLTVYVYYRYGIKRSVLLGLLLLPAVIFIFSQFRAIEMDSNAMGRADTWYVGLQMLEQSPLFGVGMGNFLNYASITAHNSFVLVMSELGVIGYVLWITFIAISLIKSWKLMVLQRHRMLENDFQRQEDTELNRAMALNTAILFALIGYLMSAFFLSRSYSAFIYMLCGLATASYARIVTLQPELALDKNVRLYRLSVTGAFVSIFGMYGVVRVLL